MNNINAVITEILSELEKERLGCIAAYDFNDARIRQLWQENAKLEEIQEVYNIREICATKAAIYLDIIEKIQAIVKENKNE